MSRHRMIGSLGIRRSRLLTTATQRIILLAVVVLCVGACNQQGHHPSGVSSPPRSTPPVAPLPAGSIDDFSLAEFPSTELGTLIYLLMPNQGTKVSWDWLANSQIRWIDRGYVEEGKSAHRRGVVRVNVRGAISTVLRQRKEELAWTVVYSTDSLPKFGPQLLTVMPGSDGAGACFGELFDGCDFEPIPSLTGAGITVHELCRDSASEMTFNRIYRLTAPGKSPTLFRWSHDGGSGGTTSDYAVLLGDSEKSACSVPPVLRVP